MMITSIEEVKGETGKGESALNGKDGAYEKRRRCILKGISCCKNSNKESRTRRGKKMFEDTHGSREKRVHEGSV